MEENLEKRLTKLNVEYGRKIIYDDKENRFYDVANDVISKIRFPDYNLINPLFTLVQVNALLDNYMLVHC